MKHTPTPLWHYQRLTGFIRAGVGGEVIAVVQTNDVDGQDIVRAVNNHDRLVEVIEKGIHINRNGAYQDELEAWRSEAEAALAAAKEEE